MFKAIPTGKTRNPKRRTAKDVIPRSSVNCVIHNRYSTVSEIESFDSLTVELVRMRASEMRERYEQRVDVDKFLHQLPSREVLELYFARKICTNALTINENWTNEIAIPADVRKVVNRYAMTNTRKGRIMAYLLCLDFIESEFDYYGWDDEEVTQDAFTCDALVEVEDNMIFGRAIAELTIHSWN